MLLCIYIDIYRTYKYLVNDEYYPLFQQLSVWWGNKNLLHIPQHYIDEKILGLSYFFSVFPTTFFLLE